MAPWRQEEGSTSITAGTAGVSGGILRWRMAWAIPCLLPETPVTNRGKGQEHRFGVKLTSV